MASVDGSRESAFTPTDEFGDGSTIPMAWGDYDNDGDLDLAVGNYYNQANELYVNNGDATFAGHNEFGTGNTFAVVWGDYDNDGDLDLAVGNNGQNRLYVNNNDGSFTGEDQFGTNRTIAMAWGDYDLDGDLDVAVGNGILNVPQQNYLYINNGDGTFSEEPQFGVGQSDSVAWADYDDDGDLDLAVGNGGFGYIEQNYLYVNNGDGTFTGEPQFGTGDTAVVAWADADNDGRLDLAVGNWDGGQSYLYLNLGGGTFSGLPEFGADDTNTLAWGDYDLDGDLDVAVGNGDFYNAGQNCLYANKGDGSFVAEAQFGMGSTDAVAWADYDRDGDLDLAVGNEHHPRQNQLWTSESAPSSYIALRFVGQFQALGEGYSNRDAIGAHVSVYAADHAGDPANRRGFQQVEAKGGFSAQNAMELTFGVPNDTAVDIVIEWPGSYGSAITQTLRSVPVGQRLTVTETMLGDLNNDGCVDQGDLGILLSDWGCTGGECPGDCDGDGDTDHSDLGILLAHWGEGCP